MTILTINNESNNIIFHGSAAGAETVIGAEQFSSAEELAQLAAIRSTARLIDIWNSLPGVTLVKKFSSPCLKSKTSSRRYVVNLR